jgi:glycosyltransferase involved in cell wall biosynthesis
MQLSIVTTLYQSAPYVDESYRLRTEVEKIPSDFEIVFVNDGSTDQAQDVALDFQKEDVRIRVMV